MARANLREVKSYMNFWGWTNSGGPGSSKLDADGRAIAYHGDATWVADVEKACVTIARLAESSETRKGFGGGGGHKK